MNPIWDSQTESFKAHNLDLFIRKGEKKRKSQERKREKEKKRKSQERKREKEKHKVHGESIMNQGSKSKFRIEL